MHTAPLGIANIGAGGGARQRGHGRKEGENRSNTHSQGEHPGWAMNREPRTPRDCHKQTSGQSGYSVGTYRMLDW